MREQRHFNGYQENLFAGHENKTGDHEDIASNHENISGVLWEILRVVTGLQCKFLYHIFPVHFERVNFLVSYTALPTVQFSEGQSSFGKFRKLDTF
jgi:hypothetical protein